jgi:hypothetical protein
MAIEKGECWFLVLASECPDNGPELKMMQTKMLSIYFIKKTSLFRK